MSDGRPPLDSLYEAAREIESPAELAAFLAQSCGDDVSLREEIEQLLAAHRGGGRSPARPVADPAATILPDSSELAQAAALQTGMATAFSAMVTDEANSSLLKAIGESLDVPCVVLREPTVEGSDPIVRTKSPEMPHRNSEGRYRLDGEIARGGMGAILKGRDVDLGRELAVKVLLDAHKNKPEVVQRFIEEAQIGGQLQHPGIVPVYELGQFSDKRPFFSMKLVKGETLSKLLADRAEPSADRGRFLGVFEHVCQTMAYAHSRGVIHRDLKPANVMVGTFHEVQVMDWGLAKVLSVGGIADERQAHNKQQGQSVIQTLRSGIGSDGSGTIGSLGSQTQMGSVMGTPAYMPPEQALGEIDSLDERADVFGLGAILCEILTGKPPYVGDDGTQVFRLASRGKLKDCFQRLEVCGADPELIAMTKHCLELEPNDRPRNARVLADQVTGYLESVETKLRKTETERAVQTERLEQQQHSARKLRKMNAGLAVGAVIAVATTVVAGLFWQSASIAKQDAETSEQLVRTNAEAVRQSEATARSEAKRANELKRLAEENLSRAEIAQKEATVQRLRASREAEIAQQYLYYAQMHLAQQAWREHRGLPHMHDLLTGWLPKAESPDRRGWEWFYLNSLPFQNVQTLTDSGEINAPCTVAWHVRSDRLAEGRAEGLIRIWDVDRDQTILTLKAPAPVNAYWGARWLAWNPDSHSLATGSRDATVNVWEIPSGKKLHEFRGHTSPVMAVAYNSDGTCLAAWGEDGTIKIWDADTGELIEEVVHPGGVTVGAWSPDDKFVATGHSNGTVTISGAQAGDKIAVLQGHVDLISDLVWNPESTRIASTSGDFTARIWDVTTETTVLGPLRHSHGISSVAWEPNGQRLATGSFDQTIKIWDSRTGREEVTLRGHVQSVSSLAWGPGDRLASGANDGNLKVWQSIRDQEAIALPGHVVRATSVSWNPSGKLLASGGDDGKVRIWDATTRQEILSLQAHDERQIFPQFGLIRSLAWSPDGTQLASAGLDGTAKVWEISSGREVFTLPAERGAIWCVAWHPDGDSLAAGADDGTICVVAGLKQTPTMHVFQAHPQRVRSLAWSPQGDRLASGAWADRVLKIWDPTSGTELSRVVAGDSVLSIAWSSDGKQLATGSTNFVATAWDTETLQKLSTMRGHNDFVDAVAWSPDGTRLATAGLDNSVRVWDPWTGEETFVLRGAAGMFHDVSWHPDGAQLAAACSDGHIWIWDATRGFERDVTPIALPFIDRQVALGTARREDRMWYAESYLRAGKSREALAVVKDDPYGLSRLARQFHERGNMALAEEARSMACAFLEQLRAAEPASEAPVAELADLLLMNNSDKWAVLKPTEMISEGGATLTLLNDGSVLASGTNPERDVYRLLARPGLEQITAIRLEALSDPSLPGNGPGRADGSGNFHLNELRVSSQGQPAPLTNITVAYDESQEFRNAIDGRIDATRGWSNYPRSGKSNTAVIATQLQLARTDDLKIELVFSRAQWTLHNLGRFRLSVSADSAVFTDEQHRFEVRKITDPWARLAAAYQLMGDQSALDNLLKQRPAAVAGIGMLYAVMQDWDRAIDEYSKLINDQTTDVHLLANRAVAYLATQQWNLARADLLRAVQQQPQLVQALFDRYRLAQRWRAAAESGLVLIEQHPADSLLWVRVAPLVVLAGDEATYVQFCHRVIELYGVSPNPEAAERAIKVGLLWPNAINVAELPGDTLAAALDGGMTQEQFQPWGWSTRALLAYRNGDPQSAVTYATRSEELQPTESAHAMNLVVLAMAQHRLQHSDETRVVLEEASQLVARLQADPSRNNDHDLLIAKILLREAEALVHGEAK